MKYINLISRKEILNGKGYVELYDFSKSNSSDESRVEAVTTVASICYANPNAIGSNVLYDKLAGESIGLPSTSFEFVRVAIPTATINSIKLFIKVHCDDRYNPNIARLLESERYGYYKDDMLYTNYRAVLNDSINYPEASELYGLLKCYGISNEPYYVFKVKVDIPTARQFIRHRTEWQELSRRYVSEERVGFDFYFNETVIEHLSEDFIERCLNEYHKLIEKGVKKEYARNVLPLGLMTEIWCGWTPKYFDNLVKLRCTSKAQSEINELVSAMNELIS